MNDLGLIGGAAGFFAFLLALARVLIADRGWRDLLSEVRSEMDDCTAERSALRKEVESLRSEVMLLRTELHTARWQQEAQP